MSKPISSDITLDATKFQPKSITENTATINKVIEDGTRGSDKWYTVGAQKYRDLILEGKTTFPAPVYLPGAKDATIPSREPGRTIPIRVYTPDNGQPSKGILLHTHGGGFVLGSHQGVDKRLQSYANDGQLTAISTGYRHAPEHPYPAGLEDCYDVAEHLVDQGLADYGAPLRFFAGESAGGNLAVLTAFHILRHRPGHVLKGLILLYAWFDLSMTLPQASTLDQSLILDREDLRQFHRAYLPGWDVEQRKNPGVSPLRDDLHTLASQTSDGKLPPALMICGTEDPLLDDTLLMGTKWLATGSEAVIKIYPGGVHGFTIVPGLEIGQQANEVIRQWVRERADS